VQESRLSTFLSQAQQVREGDPEVFLSGRITDAQSRLNLASLSEEGRLVEPVLAQWVQLFALLQLPPAELQQLARQWPRVTQTPAPADAGPWPLPQQVDQLVWLGLSPAQIARLAPHISLLPQRTPLNLNTASAELISASLKGLPLGQARRMVQARERQPWQDLAQANAALGPPLSFEASRHGVTSRFFRITGQLRLEDLLVRQQALARRDGPNLRILWRTSQVGAEPG